MNWNIWGDIILTLLAVTAPSDSDWYDPAAVVTTVIVSLHTPVFCLQTLHCTYPTFRTQSFKCRANSSTSGGEKDMLILWTRHVWAGIDYWTPNIRDVPATSSPGRGEGEGGWRHVKDVAAAFLCNGFLPEFIEVTGANVWNRNLLE